MPPLPVALLLVFGVGLLVGAFVNWATYSWAWHPRPISPWSTPDVKAPPRVFSDRLPIIGWFGLRRESSIHGRGFWMRPLLVELLSAVVLAALYWWEVHEQGLLRHQITAIAGAPLPAPNSAALATFFSHTVLFALMAAASLIDIDEKIIPDEITVIGALLGLVLAALSPLGLLPHVAQRAAAPDVGVEIQLPVGVSDDIHMVVEPVTPASPNLLPAELLPRPHWQGLAIALGCLAVWYFALMPRFWRRRRGALFGLRILLARVLREMRRPPLAWVVLAAAAGITAVWFRGGAAWQGVLTALIGMIVSGGLVWAVRIVGTAALQREAMGFGDVTLMMMVGTFVGWQAGIVIFFLAPFAGLVVGLTQLILRRDDVIPYGPFLCLATAAVVVFWASVWHDGPGGVQALFWIWWLIPAVLGVCVVMLGAMLVVLRNVKEMRGGMTNE